VRKRCRSRFPDAPRLYDLIFDPCATFSEFRGLTSRLRQRSIFVKFLFKVAGHQLEQRFPRAEDLHKRIR